MKRFAVAVVAVALANGVLAAGKKPVADPLPEDLKKPVNELDDDQLVRLGIHKCGKYPSVMWTGCLDMVYEGLPGLRNHHASWNVTKALRDAETEARDKARDEERDKYVKACEKAGRMNMTWLGMSTKQARWCGPGKPLDVNRTISAGGVREQWVYPGSYLYFTNDRLTTIQD